MTIEEQNDFDKRTCPFVSHTNDRCKPNCALIDKETGKCLLSETLKKLLK